MSQENLEIVRRQAQAFNERDIPMLESLYTEDCVIRLIGGFEDMMGAEFRGQATAFERMWDLIDTIGATTKIEDIREVDDRVLARSVVLGAGVASQAAASFSFAQVFSFSYEKISVNELYYSMEEALEAVGLEE
jgi:ketosteroid isomerase-like protein